MKATVTEIRKRITVQPQLLAGILSYDVDNNYPARVVDISNASTMGKSCLSLYRKHINGRGFADEKFASAPLNRWGDSADKILARICKDFARYGGFAIHVNYNAKYKITDISYISFAQIRRTTNDNKEYPAMFAIYKDWACLSFSQKDVRYIDKFDSDPEVIQMQVVKSGGWNSYKGQILYYCGEEDDYPLALFDAALEDMKTDAQSKIYKFRNVTTNFMASHAVVVDRMESEEDEDDSTGRKRNSGDEKNTFVTDMEQYQGADNAQKLIVIEKTHPDQTIEFKKIEQQNGDRQFEWTENSTRDNIRQAFQIPAVLLMQTPNKLGGAQEMIDATKTYNSVTEDERLTIEAAFMYLSQFYFKFLTDDFSIKEREAIRKEDIPSAILPDLTKNERRALAGYQPLSEGDQQTLAEKLQVGGTQSFVSIVQNSTLPVEQKAGALKVLFNMTDEQITLLNLNPAAQPVPAAPASNQNK